MESGYQLPGALPVRGDAGSLAPADPRWREWYEAHGGAVYGYVRFHVSSPDIAEDLTSETFVKALGASDRFDPTRASPRTWIIAIARNAVRDHLRQARRRRHLPLASLRDLAFDAPSPEERLLWVYARLRRGGGAARSPPRWRVQLPWASAVALLGAALALVLWVGRDPTVRLDRCCWDLDGGGVADDGVLVIAAHGERIRSLRIYEDTDGSGRWSDGDVPRLPPEGPREPPGPLAAGLSTRQFCCLDYDAGGAADDGIFVLGAPPDRVFLAGVYEDRDGTGEVSAADFLRYVVR